MLVYQAKSEEHLGLPGMRAFSKSSLKSAYLNGMKKIK
jgi:hypothetical protein